MLCECVMPVMTDTDFVMTGVLWLACDRSYANYSLVKYMERHKVKPDSKSFHLVRDARHSATALSVTL